MKKIYVVGSLNMDLTVNTAVFPQKGQTVTGNGFMTTAGGKGANQAVACARSGANVYMVGCVGQAFGGELLSSLAGYGVDTSYVRKAQGVSSGIAVILVHDGDNRIILDRGANGCVTKELVDEAFATARAGDYLVVQLEVNSDAVEYALRAAKTKGMVTVLNPAPAAPLNDNVLAACDYFTPNQTEAQFYTGVFPQDEASAKTCSQALAQKGVKNVIITMGEQGSAGVCGGEFVKVAAFPVKAVDTTAAGDTYLGAFVAMLAEGESVPSAMRFASAASALAVTRRGAQISIPSRKETEAFLQTR